MKNKKLTRRGLLGAITTLAAAAVVAPAAKVEAAPEQPSRNSEIAYRCEMGEAWCTQHLDQNGAGHWHSIKEMLAEARAEGYERREFIEAKRAESRAQEPISGYMLSLQNLSGRPELFIANTGRHAVTIATDGRLISPGQTAKL